MEKNENKPMKFLQEKSKEIFILILLIAGALLIILGSIDFNGKKEGVQYTDVEFYTEYLENKIARMCENIGGISEAKILLTLDCSSEYVYGDSASDYIILKNNNEEEAVMLREIYPRVRGIAVVCTGGRSAENPRDRHRPAFSRDRNSGFKNSSCGNVISE